MRAVARGMVLKTLPACPEQCGGPGADLSALSADVRSHRERHGCDRDIPEGDRVWYAIRCPRCDGSAQSGQHCEVCSGSDLPGFVPMRRCPASQCSPDIFTALDALEWMRSGFLPHGSSMGDQAASFVEFRRLFEAEFREAMNDQKGD